MLFAIDSINSDQKLLPTVTLSYDIRDTCYTPNIALDESLDWVVTASALQPELCVVNQSVSKLSAVVGAAFSQVSIPLASLLRLFAIPQVSYASTSPILNDRNEYSYFLRTIPPDNYQALGMVQLVQEFGWTYVSAIHSNDAYGDGGIEEFRQVVANSEICIDFDRGIDSSFDDSQVLQVANELVYNTTADVVILFSHSRLAAYFLEQLQTLNSARKFVWIVSEGILHSPDLLASFGRMQMGVFGLVPYTPTFPAFDDYFSQLTPANNTRNPWFTEYCMEQDCNTDSYQQNNAVPLVVNAVYSVAHGLHNFLTDNCDPPVMWNKTTQTCAGQVNDLNGTSLLDYIKKVNFTSVTGSPIQFDSNGNIEDVVYNVLNLQLQSADFTAEPIGNWTSYNGKQQLNLAKDKDELQFGVDANGMIVHQWDSQCSQCLTGNVPLTVPSSCCKLCTPCQGDQYTNSTTDTECSTCPQYYWGNDPLVASNSCVPLLPIYQLLSDPLGVTILVLGPLGIVTVAIVSIVIGIFWKNPVIKSFGREQLILLLLGMMLSFALPLVYVFKPSTGVCVIQHIALWFSLTLIFAALLIKLIRITRIFLGKLGSRHRKFIAPHYQVLFTLLVVLGQMILVGISLSLDNGVVIEQQNSTLSSTIPPTLLLQCKPPRTVLLTFLTLYETILIVAINGFAIFTIRFPENFNEARHIAFATFAIGVAWLAFLPTYFSSSNKYKDATIVLVVMLMSSSVLVCLLGPRLYTALRSIQWNMNTRQSNSQSHIALSEDLLPKLNSVHKEPLDTPVHNKFVIN